MRLPSLVFYPVRRRSTGISQLLEKLEAYLPPAQILERVRDSYEFGAQRHHAAENGNIRRASYITHPVAVADILADLAPRMPIR